IQLFVTFKPLLRSYCNQLNRRYTFFTNPGPAEEIGLSESFLTLLTEIHRAYLLFTAIEQHLYAIAPEIKAHFAMQLKNTLTDWQNLLPNELQRELASTVDILPSINQTMTLPKHERQFLALMHRARLKELRATLLRLGPEPAAR